MEQPLVKNAFDVLEVRKDFPILSELPYGKPLVYFDNAATSQKPQVVIDALENDAQWCASARRRCGSPSPT